VNRGASIKPRGTFDVAAAAERHADAIIAALRRYPGAVNVTLGKLNELNPELVNRAIQALMIRD
jgi:hypothetical protein